MDNKYKGGLGDTAMQRAWMRFADANEVPHDHEDEDAFKYGFDAALSDDGWKQRCEELEVAAAALYLGHDGGRELFEMYKSVYLGEPAKGRDV